MRLVHVVRATRKSELVKPRSVMWPRRIVCIDPDTDFRTVASLLLRARGHCVAEASDAAAGLDLIAHHLPDVVFMDPENAMRHPAAEALDLLHARPP